MNFNQYVLDAGGNRHGDRILNLYKGMLGMNTTNDVEGTRDRYHNLKLSDEHFSTFIGDFVLDFGPIGAAILVVLFTLLFLKLTKVRKHTISFPQLLVLFYILSVAMQGGFYLYPYSFNRAGIFITYLFLYFLFSYDNNTLRNEGKISYLQTK